MDICENNNELFISGVSVEFSGLRALDKVNLTLRNNEIVGLIGPNGSGKTTLVNAITGQVPIINGTIKLGNNILSKLKPRLISCCGVARTFQIVRLFDNLTILENIQSAALAQGIKRNKAITKARELIEEFGLAHVADEIAGHLSYGDKRRVEIARALAANPRFLLLDEPAAGMNQEESDVLLKLLQELPASRKLGIMIIDHDMPLIMRLCNRIHVLASGKTIAEGDVDSIRQNQAVIEAYLGSSADVSR